MQQKASVKPRLSSSALAIRCHQSSSQTRSAITTDWIVRSCVLKILCIGTAGSLLAITGRNGDVKRWKPACFDVAGRLFSRSSEAALRCPPNQAGSRDMKPPATGAGVVRPRKLSCTVSRCFAVFGESGSAIDEDVAFDELESDTQDLAKLLLRPNINLALLLTELIVSDRDVLLTGVCWSILRKGKHLPSPRARSPLAYILLASLPKPKSTNTRNALTSQTYR